MDEDALNDEGTPLEIGDSGVVENAPAPHRQQKHNKQRKYLYIAVGIAVLLVLFIASAMIFKKDPAPKVTPTPITINTQSLDNGTLNKLTAQSGADQTKQQLTITPDTLFKNSVEVQGPLKADGNVDVGGNLTVNGATTMQGAVGINNNLAVRGSLSVGGALSAGSINVGTLSISTITVSGNLNFGGHIVPTGATPAVKPSVASGGGSVTVSGNDTAGTITITTGSGATTAGELMNLTFRTAFAGTPKVQLTPINGEASTLNYYAPRSAGFFTIRTSSPPAPNTSYVFDYLVTQ